MRKLMVSEFMSLDGGMEAPGGEPGYRHSGWAIEHMGEEQMAYKLAEVLAAESLLSVASPTRDSRRPGGA